jgi:hypothetical protein
MDRTVTAKILELRYSHYEEKRKEKVRVLLEEREQVVKDEEDGLIEFDEEEYMFKSIMRSQLTMNASVSDSKILDREKKTMD